MFESDIDRIVAQHDSDYINGTKSMFASGWLDDDETEADEESWDDLPDWEKQERLDAAKKWAEWMFGRKVTK